MTRIVKCAIGALLMCATSLVMAAQLPVRAFSQLPSVTHVNLSPSGNQIALIENLQNPEISVLVTYNLQTGAKKYLVKSDNEDVKINWFNWANEKTLIVSVRQASQVRSVRFTETRLLAMDVDGEEVVQRNIIKPRGTTEVNHVSQFQDNVISFLPDDPDHIMVAIDLDLPNNPSVYKLNIYSRNLSRITKGKMMVRDWMADRQGNLRLGEALDYDSGKGAIRYRMGDEDKWLSMFEYDAFSEPGVKPLGFALDPNILYYRAYQDDKLALFKINLSTLATELVFSDPDYDVDGSLIYSRKTRDVIGIRHANSPTGRIYWDEDYNKFQQALDKAMPDTSNYLVDFSDDENVYLLYSESDETPGVYYLGNRKNKSLEGLFEQYPLLTSHALSRHKLVSYTARDGTKLEGYLTVPEGAQGPVATILHPHGGPGAREYDGFDYWTSLFVSRGYAVFRPNFRGSTGYGRQFAESQMQAWGLAMQDDLTDAANWLVEQQIADPQRMCIVGASYGGYAATMAAVKTPDLFKCAVSFAGVMNLKDLVSKSRNFINRKFVRQQIGEDSDDLKARSPYYHADKVKIPILLAHGEDDRVVDFRQSAEFADKLAGLGKEVKYLKLQNGDHYLSIQRNRHAFFTEMDAFLQQHLGQQN